MIHRFTYISSRIGAVKDTGSAAYSNDFRYSNTTSTTYSYTHDAAGRMTKDTAKGISSITWNVLGLPQTVTFSNGNVINYSYAADGTKLREVRTVSGMVLETDDYYPLGGPLPTGTSTALQPEKYQGKDWNPTASFNVYDFGARLYDPALGRWLSQDPMAEKYYPHSPYLFCAGNPMKFVDPDGSSEILTF